MDLSKLSKEDIEYNSIVEKRKKEARKHMENSTNIMNNEFNTSIVGEAVGSNQKK
jgi:hypothetical protein